MTEQYHVEQVWGWRKFSGGDKTKTKEGGKTIQWRRLKNIPLFKKGKKKKKCRWIWKERDRSRNFRKILESHQPWWQCDWYLRCFLLRGGQRNTSWSSKVSEPWITCLQIVSFQSKLTILVREISHGYKEVLILHEILHILNSDADQAHGVMVNEVAWLTVTTE